jgi:hypothetical protein
MGFFAPWFLGGLLVVGLPVWLHMLRMHKTTPLPFSSLMFFEQRTQSSIKHRRLRYLLLFALRAALVALLAIAFAKPFLSRLVSPVASGKALKVLAIDNSFSMRAGGRMERAKAEAVRFAGGGRAQVLSFGAQVHLLTEATDDTGVLRAAIQSVQPGDTRGSFAELARAVRQIARSSQAPIVLHLFSDLQNTEMPSNFADARLGEGVQLVPHSAGSAGGNWAVESVRAPRRVYTSGKVRVQATVAGFGTEKATRKVSLLLNGRVIETKTVEVPAAGRAAVEFLSLEAAYGMNRGEVRIDAADALHEDDFCYFSIERGEPRRALFVHDAANPRGLLYFRAALESPSETAFQIDAATVEQAVNLAPAKYSFVVLSDTGPLPVSLEKDLRNYVRGGGAVLVVLGRASAVGPRVPVFDEKVQEARYSGREGERFQTAAWLDPAHPSIGKDDRWEDVKFYQAVRVDSGKSRVAARLSDQTPLLMEKQVGEGRVLVFASTFDNIANDFPIHAAFVPFIEQTARYLARLDEGQANLLVGSYLDLRSVQERGASVEVIDPSGARALSLEEAARAQNIQLARAGFYEVRRPNKRDDLVAVNADRRESDLAPVPPDTLALWENTGNKAVAPAGNAVAGEEESKPVSVWWYIMLCVLALAVAESLLGNRHLAVDKEAA